MSESGILDAYLDDAGRAVDGIDRDSLSRVAEVCIAAVRAGGTLYFCGNGGSAADSQHLAGELVGRFRMERPGIRAVSLSSNMAVITAIANDYDFDRIYSRQVETMGRAGDVLVAISTSGESANILRAAEAAHGAGMRVVALTGIAASTLASLSDAAFVSPSTLTSHSQEAILIAGHAICAAVEDACSGGSGGSPC
jgi:D-sedoheptulose 7-phosphate isomerase